MFKDEKLNLEALEARILASLSPMEREFYLLEKQTAEIYPKNSNAYFNAFSESLCKMHEKYDYYANEKTKEYNGSEYKYVNSKLFIIRKGWIFWQALDNTGKIIMRDTSLDRLKWRISNEYSVY